LLFVVRARGLAPKVRKGWRPLLVGRGLLAG
jgi:hypothetical protein